MILRHLRSNVVAYLALLVALTSSSYAAVQIADGSVTSKKLAKNSVTSIKIKKSAVRAADVKDGALTGADVRDHTVAGTDLVDGVVPGDAAVFTRLFAANMQPSANPDAGGVQAFEFSLPRGGTVELKFFSAALGSDCSAGGSFVGLYFDGKPIANSGSASYLTSNAGAALLLGTVVSSAGAHTASVGFDCPAGNWNGSSMQWPAWEVSLLSE
jgi:hypothetical protein